MPEFGLTVAVKVTESPYVDGLFEDITAVVVGRLVKVTEAVCVMVTESDASVAV